MKFWIVDAFADRPFVGNPAAVFLVQEFPSTSVMQSIAAEINLSETAFVKRLGLHHYHIRWFTPNSEAPLCGHATIAATHVLINTNAERNKVPIKFESLSGRLLAESDVPWITLNFPRYVVQQIDPDPRLHSVIDCKPIYTGFSQNCYFMEFEKIEQIIELRPNLQLLSEIEFRALIVTAKGTGKFHEYDFVSRYFAPRVGINEDPVCASAHCRLIPYWSAKLGKGSLIAYQASKRGGIISCEDLQNRVLISGTATTVIKGELC
ncbi:MAG: PhzF family phenazine biosynthesis protein [Candidatus Midichloria sp.]|nr:PhzF family phenazine biosynthesis protein [Candidatus Midichloria sp.]